MARNQRERLIAGLTEVLHEVGYEKTTVSLIGRRAGVSKSDFYKHFESKDACFVATYESAVARIRGRVLAACAAHPGDQWPPRMRDGITSLIELLAAEPPLAGITLVEGLRAGRGVYNRYQAALDSFVPLIRDGAPAPPGGGEVPAATDEAVVGGIASLLGGRILAGEQEQLGQLAPTVLEFALTPYLGTAEARRIVSAG